MSKKKLIIALCILAVLFAFFGDCKMSCKVGRDDNGDTVSVPENQKEISETEVN